MAATMTPGTQRQTYIVVNAPGGVYHVYPNGRRVFVPKPVQAAGPGNQLPAARGPGVGVPTASGPGAGVGASSGPRMTPANSTLGVLSHGAAAAPSSQGVTPQGAADQQAFSGDSQFFAEAAQRRFKGQADTASLNQQSAYAKTDREEALRRLVEQRVRDIQTSRESANRQGLFYSGHQGQAEGDINTSYIRQQSDLERDADRAEAAREAARRGIEAGYSIDDAAGLAAAVDRQQARDTAAADAGALAPPQKPKPKPKAKAKKASAGGPGFMFNGRRVRAARR